MLGTKTITIDSHSLETCLAVVLQWFIRNYPPSRTQFLVEFVLQYQIQTINRAVQKRNEKKHTIFFDELENKSNNPQT